MKPKLPVQTRPRIDGSLEDVNQHSTSRGIPCRAGLARRPSQRSARAFTLVELMIVLTVLLILVVVAIPNYQQARNPALIKSIIGELIGYAKACAVINSSGLGETPTPPAIAVDRGGVVILQGCSAVNEGATLQASWGGARASGVTCLSDSSESTSRQANLTISAGNLLSCSFVD